jgi:hypothetical protein
MKLFTAIAGVLRAQLFKLLDALRDGRLISGQAVAHADRFAVRLPDHVNDFKPGSRVSIVIAAGIFSALSAGCAGVKADTNAATTETIVLLRHGEKPPGGLGQLNCRGLNRALALPTVIAKQFGKPDAIFAPDPAETKLDAGQPYDYVRPLATIEPTAIAFGLPVDTSIGVSKLGALKRRLEARDLHEALVLVAWEHSDLVLLVRMLVADYGGDPAMVPSWDGQDFDSIYVVKITRAADKTSVIFEHRSEGLDSQPQTCPGQASG